MQVGFHSAERVARQACGTNPLIAVSLNGMSTADPADVVTCENPAACKA